MFYPKNVVESGHFKRLDQGFIFQPPHPWVFGYSPRYLATDIQKATILDVMAPDSRAGNASQELSRSSSWGRFGS
jgi:hypothetical protein